MPSDTMNTSVDIIQFYNCRILRNNQITKEDLWVSEGKIIDPEVLFYVDKLQPTVKIDCNNHIIAPGIIEMQINGAFGFDFSCPTEDLELGVKKVAKGLLAHGVTSFCPTVITSTRESYRKILPQIKRCEGSCDGAGVLGIHIEGPFISMEKKGAHPPQCIRTFDNGIEDLLEMYGCLDDVALVTLAPELPSSNVVIKSLVQRGIAVSLGHSMANLSQGEEAVRNGASFITHLFNAMLPFHHRDPHLVGLLASNEIPRGVFYGIIADGIHTHEAALRIAYSTHKKGIVLVTDAIPAMGLGDGVHHMGEQVLEIKDNHAYVAGTNTLAGSVATIPECMRFFRKATGCKIEEAIEAATLHPAQALGIESSKGTLDFGTDADFIFMDDGLNVVATYIAGDCVWESSKDIVKTKKLL